MAIIATLISLAFRSYGCLFRLVIHLLKYLYCELTKKL